MKATQHEKLLVTLQVTQLCEFGFIAIVFLGPQGPHKRVHSLRIHEGMFVLCLRVGTTLIINL